MNIEILEGNPFANDELNREDSAKVLTQFVCSANQPLVICIDAPWGQGKTTFLLMWEQYLKDQNIPTIYFNAWENDFTDDALVSLIGEIGFAVDRLAKPENAHKAHEYLDKAKKLGIGLIKRSIPVAAKIVTAGALDLDQATEEAFATLSESVAKEQLDKYEKSKNSLIAFRTSLAELASSFDNAEDKKPLIFIIDELDRCRPTFSIELLEKVKHFFNVKNIVFVLGADKDQLSHAIRAVYGAGLDTNGYLRRFIDFDYLLPLPERGLFLKALFKSYGFNEYFSSKKAYSINYEREQALAVFGDLFEIYQLTLREQQHCCSLLNVCIKTTPSNNKLFPIFLCYLIVQKIKKPELYKQIVHESIQLACLVDMLAELPGGKKLLETKYGVVLEAYIVDSNSGRSEYENIIQNYEIIGSASSEASLVEKQRANSIARLMSDHDWDGGNETLRYLINKMEIASRFKS
ncbi:MAG: P-loop NTPase fold protein [Methylicorpusculum sp.]|uniref:KAP family P-loop NTPase fold protein n=1 Tax=Methylicorpusculum sp. TaxID=2713644 RepID=UPI00271BD95D|nr:P-loop NTPase fold protein [Methylicorpusculum sp.]MDO8939154.1 P-loop NTPase fold protein [Methylicorpusculum sp.]MDP2201491.1 P-loop NTPase fold protein [Methylicorpusculum sp.]